MPDRTGSTVAVVEYRYVQISASVDLDQGGKFGFQCKATAMSDHSQLGKLGLFDARVPRYTSYPTALHFTNAIGPDDSKRWISAIPAGNKISLYLHIPFCRRLCWFCACRTQGTTTLSPVLAYVETLKQELALVGSMLKDGVTVEHLHWGGGTPTLLSPASITDLAQAIFRHLPLADDAQFSVEIDPNEIDEARLDALNAAGMNRASIGVQDFDPAIQQVIGRTQSYETTQEAVEMLRNRGISSLNMDILYGLPHQSLDRIADSVTKVLSLSPDRVALYGYAHVPWMAKRQALIPTEALPTPPDRLDLFEMARGLFVQDGYMEIGIDHFARPDDGLAMAQKSGTLHRNFQGYTEDTSEVLIGIGASAISRFGQGYGQNAPATSAYQRAVRGGKLATQRGHRFIYDDLVRARMIEVLMCDFGIRYDALAAELGQPVGTLRAMTATLGLKYHGMVSDTETALKILPHARALTRMIAREIDAYTVPASGHSHAV